MVFATVAVNATHWLGRTAAATTNPAHPAAFQAMPLAAVDAITPYADAGRSCSIAAEPAAAAAGGDGGGGAIAECCKPMQLELTGRWKLVPPHF